MARSKTKWVCQECGAQSSRFLGRCTQCNSWNCMVEEMQVEPAIGPRASATTHGALSHGGPELLCEIDTTQENARFVFGIPSVEEVLGGGLVPGSVLLLAGDPGVGKSTFLLQLAKSLAQENRVLYVSGEESKQQVRLRAERLDMHGSSMLLDSEQNVLTIEQHMLTSNAQFVFIDSIQTMFHPELSSAPGSVSQVRETAAVLVNCAKSKGICTVIVGHVTKDGSIAGPRVLEHMVDVVLHFEGDRQRQLRILRAVKNRFGSTSEIAIFTMSADGLKEVDNPSALFLGERLSKLPGERAPSGTAVLASAEGNRSLLLEVQALVGVCAGGSPRRVTNGCDYNRVQQIIAVLDKRVGLAVSKQDVYVNIVGGFEFADPGGDLAISVAIATSCMDRSVDPYTVSIGEVGLSGELRPVSLLDRRLREAQRMGFKKAIVPAANMAEVTASDQLEVIGVEYLVDALGIVMPGISDKSKKAPATPVPWVTTEEQPGMVLEDSELMRLLQ